MADGIVSFRTAPMLDFPWDAAEFAWQPELLSASKPDPLVPVAPISEWQWAVIVFDSPTLCVPDGVLIGSRLDTDLHSKTCRLAFYGNVVAPIDSAAAR